MAQSSPGATRGTLPRPAFPGLAFAPGPRPPSVSGGKRWPGLVIPGHKARPGHIERTERVLFVASLV